MNFWNHFRLWVQKLSVTLVLVVIIVVSTTVAASIIRSESSSTSSSNRVIIVLVVEVLIIVLVVWLVLVWRRWSFVWLSVFIHVMTFRFIFFIEIIKFIVLWNIATSASSSLYRSMTTILNFLVFLISHFCLNTTFDLIGTLRSLLCIIINRSIVIHYTLISPVVILSCLGTVIIVITSIPLLIESSIVVLWTHFFIFKN